MAEKEAAQLAFAAEHAMQIERIADSQWSSQIELIGATLSE